MNLTNKEAKLIFAIMQDWIGEFDHAEVRKRVGESLLTLLAADFSPMTVLRLLAIWLYDAVQATKILVTEMQAS